MADSGNPIDEQRHAVLAVLATLLAPVARLCIARAVTIQAVEELVRQAFVQEARRACADLNSDRLTSRISTMTGLTRREVDRLESSPRRQLPATRSPATDVLTLWMSLPGYLDKGGRPRVLSRTGAQPSFDALASLVTRDVHPRTLMAELVRLQMVEHDLQADTLKVVTDAFVPTADQTRMLGFLGTNVGDHLQAAVTNVLGTGSQHFEQALLADEMSTHSVDKARLLIRDQWRGLMTTLVPKLQELIEEDERRERPQDSQLRIGLYSWSSPMPVDDHFEARASVQRDRKDSR